jgi:putative Mg2+ transporter-C (MgtC) family protein
MDLELPVWETVLRLLLAAGLGGIIGLDRERRSKAAGLRTNMMVSLGAAAFTVMGLGLVVATGSGDPTRVVTGVATGIGFLGAGSIMKSGRDIHGVTTAAGIWVLGAVGAACGIGSYAVAVSATLLSLAILFPLGEAESRIDGSSDED